MRDYGRDINRIEGSRHRLIDFHTLSNKNIKQIPTRAQITKIISIIDTVRKFLINLLLFFRIFSLAFGGRAIRICFISQNFIAVLWNLRIWFFFKMDDQATQIIALCICWQLDWVIYEKLWGWNFFYFILRFFHCRRILHGGRNFFPF